MITLIIIYKGRASSRQIIFQKDCLMITKQDTLNTLKK